MKRKLKLWQITLLILLAAYLMQIGFTVSLGPHFYWTYWFAQRNLARELNVRINDYPTPYLFPIGYFRDTLNQNMSIEEVHDRVLRYEQVFRCGESEVYYYFDADEDKALKFKIFYKEDTLNSHARFLSLNFNSDYPELIRVNGCQIGLLEE